MTEVEIDDNLVTRLENYLGNDHSKWPKALHTLID